MKEIRGNAKNLRTLLDHTRFAIDYYQREYRWRSKQVAELIEDLADKFKDSHDARHDRKDVEHYGHYFLGSIIVSDKDGSKYIIDGQQRLTTLTLLLIYIYRNLDDADQQAQLAGLVFSQKFGKKSFNLNVEERNECMEALFRGEAFDESEQPESVVNILHRYSDVEELFPDDIASEALPHFADWLIENVHLVEITAYSDADAYTIFETMNDRGLSLTPTEMLKGYLLANISEGPRRDDGSRRWQEQVARLRILGKDEDADAIKAWLRSQYAESIRKRKRFAKPRDFDRIGTEFHRWVREHAKTLGLSSSEDFARVIREDFAFYGRWYSRLRTAAKTREGGLDAVHFCAQNNFTLQYPVLLAPLVCGEDEPAVLRKLRVVSAYLDILIARRIWNWKSISYSTMQYAMFLVMREIRGKDAPVLADILVERLDAEPEFNDRFALHGTNRPQVHRLLARMTEYVETRSDRPSRYHEYVQRGWKKGYQVEHIWADKPNEHLDDFLHHSEFSQYRNRIGGLLLLPGKDNASYGGLPYEEKLPHYVKQNLLAQSLHENSYKRDPGFRRFVEESGLPFKPHAHFRKADLDERQALYRGIAELVWNPDRLERAAES